jgi:hypothetical protein
VVSAVRQSITLQERNKPKKYCRRRRQTNERQAPSEGCQHTRPLVKNLSAPPQKVCQPEGPISGKSSSPSKLIRTLMNFPPTESSSIGSSSIVSPSTSSLSPQRPHFPLSGRSPTKYTLMPGTSETSAKQSLSLCENAILSSPVLMVIGPRKQWGSETETPP